MSKHRITTLWRRLIAKPDRLMLEVGAGGEHLIAKIRVATVMILLLFPLVHIVSGGSFSETVIGAGGTLLALFVSLLWLRLSRPGRIHAWLPFASSGSDVSIITLVLFMLSMADPAAALNSLVTWTIYPLAIFVTAMRNDMRVTVFTGVLAMVEFGGLWFYLEQQSLGPIRSDEYGLVIAANIYQRLLLLAATTFVTAAIVSRVQKLVTLSGYDPLTRLPNRVYLQHRGAQLIVEARASGQEISLALLDIERMKLINERFGSEVGDQVIRHFATTIRQLLPDQEPLMRLGGQSFVQFLDMPIANAYEAIESARKQLIQQAFVTKDNISVLLSFGAGIASSPLDGLDLSALMKRADERLLLSKKGGLSRVVARS